MINYLTATSYSSVTVTSTVQHDIAMLQVYHNHNLYTFNDSCTIITRIVCITV